jgi:hypothetical protein
MVGDSAGMSTGVGMDVPTLVSGRSAVLKSRCRRFPDLKLFDRRGRSVT